MRCLSDEELAAIDDHSSSALEDPASETFAFDDAVTYRCPKAMAFMMGNDTTADTVEYKCQWDGEWSRDTDEHPQCGCA